MSRYDLIEVTAIGSPVRQYIHNPTGTWIEEWCDWLWTDPAPPTEDPR